MDWLKWHLLTSMKSSSLSSASTSRCSYSTFITRFCCDLKVFKLCVCHDLWVFVFWTWLCSGFLCWSSVLPVVFVEFPSCLFCWVLHLFLCHTWFSLLILSPAVHLWFSPSVCSPLIFSCSFLDHFMLFLFMSLNSYLRWFSDSSVCSFFSCLLENLKRPSVSYASLFPIVYTWVCFLH